jgi:hypothetical protein
MMLISSCEINVMSMLLLLPYLVMTVWFHRAIHSGHLLPKKQVSIGAATVLAESMSKQAPSK